MRGKGYLFWVKGLAMAVVHGVGAAVVMAVGDPTHFNLAAGAHQLESIAILAGLIAGINYIIKPPKADDDPLTVRVPRP